MARNFLISKGYNGVKNYLNYKSDEAENLKKTYSSWIGRDAHTGHGKKQILRDITITKRRLPKPLAETAIYKVEFIFEPGVILSAYEFLSYNSLISENPRPEVSQEKSQNLV